jgi:NADH-quinone oxidoreductase subunit C
MFGIFFKNHSDFRRRLTDYGFKGHALRKDFPVTGFIEVRYDLFSKSIQYESVSLPQEYRFFFNYSQ